MRIKKPEVRSQFGRRPAWPDGTGHERGRRRERWSLRGTAPFHRDRRGQAILELVVGLVAMLVVFAGLLQIGGLNRLHTRAMIESRSEAAKSILSGAIASSDAHYILDCTPGNDGRRYTRDDGYTDSGNLQDGELAFAQSSLPTNADPDNPIVNLFASFAANPDFDLVHGEMQYTTNLFPIISKLLYNADSMDIEVYADVFMTRTGALP